MNKINLLHILIATHVILTHRIHELSSQKKSFTREETLFSLCRFRKKVPINKENHIYLLIFSKETSALDVLSRLKEYMSVKAVKNTKILYLVSTDLI